LVTPALGTPTSGVATNLTGLPLTTGVTGLLPVANGGTATATPSIVAGTNVTVTGTWPNQTIAASGGVGTVTSVALSGGTTGLTVSGSPITSSGTITVDGTLAVANGGTGVSNNPAMTVTGSGNFAYTRTLTGTTNVTFPTTGTLSTLAGSETLTNKTISGASNTLSNIPLSTGVTGNLPVTNLNSGTSASASTFWRGDGSWAAAGGSSATPTAEGSVYGKMTASGGSPFLTALGYNAGVGTTGIYNTAVGTFALQTNSTGTYNTTTGAYSMYGNTTGSRNTASGYYAMTSNETGGYNTALGYEALYGNTSGSYSTAVGWTALRNATTGGRCTAVGRQALLNNTTATGNSAFGADTLKDNTTGSQNTAVGEDAMRLNSTGTYSAVVGFEALYSATGNSNTALGAYAGLNITSGQGNIAIGGVTSAGGVLPAFDIVTESNRISMGHTSITNAYIKVAFTVTSDARDKTNVSPIPHGLDFVKQLNPVSYNFKVSREDDTPDGNKRYGFLAQDILALEGNSPVIIDNEKPDHLKYQGESLVPVLVKALQELNAKFDAYVASHP
jgi:hypothetical protein